ncbi:ABC transporter permease [Thermodesulfovibrio sp.]|jgi:ABC-2 type transport system permease protein|uniref:ABC transporter permease n=1 Tax=Thermodesulfovibrio TaxID=28261 RepID=UPI00262C61D5|nr:ABC transporter permease [Thermodesulfovibrio sp.]
MLRRLLAILKKEFRELFRDPLYLTFAFLVPVVIIILMGYGLILDVKNISVSFIDFDRSKLSREYRYSFTNSEYFRFHKLITSYKEAEELIKSGESRVVVVIPPDFSRKLYGGKPAEVQVLIDGSFPMRAEVMKGYVSAINMQFNQNLIENFLKNRGMPLITLPLSVETRAWYNPSLESKNFILPGELVTTLMFYSVLLASLIVVREKESGSIFNLYCSPVKAWEVVFGKAIPYVTVSFVTYLIIFLLTVGLFQTKFTGSFLFLTFSTVIYLFCTVGIGVFISIVTKTQITAMLIAFLGTIIPSFIYSGYFSPVTSMSETAQIISKTIPASYFMGIVRGVYLKGIGDEGFLLEVFSLLVYAAVVYTLAILSFQKRVG